MPAARWSPRDLHQQRLLVRMLALRAEQNRRRLSHERRAFIARLRRAVGSPAMLAAAFAAGFLLFRPGARKQGAATVSRVTRRVRNVGASVAWLVHLYRQFMRGIAAGAALTAPRSEPEPVHGYSGAAYGNPLEEK